MQSKKLSKGFVKFSVILVIAATAFFFYRTLSTNWQKIQDYEFSLNYLYVFLGLSFLVAAVALSGYLWGQVLKALTGKTVTPTFAIQTHIYAWLLKYIPGKTGLVLGKIALGAKEGFGKKPILISTVYENIFLVIASFASSVPFLGFLFYSEVSSNFMLFLPSLLVIPMIVLIYPPIFYRFVNLGFKIIKRKPLEQEFFLSTKQIVKLVTMYLVPRILNGIGFVFLVKSFVAIDASMYVGLGATFVFSSIIGLLSFLTPGGVGVREVIMVLLLGSYFSPEISVMIAVISRLFVTIGDIVLLFVKLSLKYLNK